MSQFQERISAAIKEGRAGRGKWAIAKRPRRAVAKSLSNERDKLYAKKVRKFAKEHGRVPTREEAKGIGIDLKYIRTRFGKFKNFLALCNLGCNIHHYNTNGRKKYVALDMQNRYTVECQGLAREVADHLNFETYPLISYRSLLKPVHKRYLIFSKEDYEGGRWMASVIGLAEKDKLAVIIRTMSSDDYGTIIDALNYYGANDHITKNVERMKKLAEKWEGASYEDVLNAGQK